MGAASPRRVDIILANVRRDVPQTKNEGQDDLQSKFGSFFEHYIQRGIKVCIYYLYADEIVIGLTSDNTKDVTESCR